MSSILSLQKLGNPNGSLHAEVAHSNGSSTCVGLSCSSDGCNPPPVDPVTIASS